MRPRSDRTAGSVSIEAVLIVPLFLLAIVATLEASLWVQASTVAQAAAQDGVRAGTRYGAGGAPTGQAVAEEILVARPVGSDWLVTSEASPQGLTITISGQARSILPGLNLAVHESATLPWEGR